MSPRLLALGLTIGLVSLFAVVPSPSAQVDPTSMRSGLASGTGGGTTTPLFAVPAGSTFVLTDFTWSPDLSLIGPAQFTAGISIGTGPAISRWGFMVFYATGSGSLQGLPVIEDWTTGVVFSSGETMRLSLGPLPGGLPWSASWAGYVTVPGPAAIGEDSPRQAPPDLGQNLPNPFNPTTEIRYSLSSPGKADLRIYDSMGRLVRTLAEGAEQAGEHAVLWDGRDGRGEPLASGVYYYALTTDAGSQARKALLLK